MILSQAQAAAIYAAMCALNNVGGGVTCTLDVVKGRHNTEENFLRVFDDEGVVIVVRVVGYHVAEREAYADQSAFALAYSVGSAA